MGVSLSKPMTTANIERERPTFKVLGTPRSKPAAAPTMGMSPSKPAGTAMGVSHSSPARTADDVSHSTSTTTTKPKTEDIKLVDRKTRHMISFYDLPPELRNDIYTLALTVEDPIKIETESPQVAEPALTRASKQIRAESLPIFYNVNVFESPFATDVDDFLELCKKRKQLSWLTSVRCRANYSFEWTNRYLTTKVRTFGGKKGLGENVVAVRLIVEGVGVVWATKEQLPEYWATLAALGRARRSREVILPREGNVLGLVPPKEGGRP